jgi:hypothetical protein
LHLDTSQSQCPILSIFVCRCRNDVFHRRSSQRLTQAAVMTWSPGAVYRPTTDCSYTRLTPPEVPHIHHQITSCLSSPALESPSLPLTVHHIFHTFTTDFRQFGGFPLTNSLCFAEATGQAGAGFEFISDIHFRDWIRI